MVSKPGPRGLCNIRPTGVCADAIISRGTPDWQQPCIANRRRQLTEYPQKGNPLMSAPASPTMTVEQDRLYREASALLATLNEVVPASTVHFAVEAARRALHQLLTSAATIRTSDARRAAGEGW